MSSLAQLLFLPAVLEHLSFEISVLLMGTLPVWYDSGHCDLSTETDISDYFFDLMLRYYSFLQAGPYGLLLFISNVLC